MRNGLTMPFKPTSLAETTPLLDKRPQVDHIDPKDVSTLKRRLLVFTIFLGAFLSSLDMTIVATCIPTISSDLHLSNQASWIGTSYLWATVTFTPLYGRLSDIIGRRRAYLQASILFGFGTLLCGISPNLPCLAAARFIAGMGGGGIGTVGSVVIADLVSPRDRGLYQSIFFIGLAAGMGSGGPIGGLITQHFGWHAAFYTQIPAVAICILIAGICIPPSKRDKITARAIRERVDWLGASSLLFSIGSLLFGLSLYSNSQLPFTHPLLLASIASFATFFLVFVYVEIYVAREPVLPLELLKQRTAVCVGIISGLVAVVNFTMVYLLPLLYELVFGQSISVAGSHLIPNSAAMIIGAPTVGLLIRRTGRYKWLTVLCCLGPLTSMLWLAFLKDDAKVGQWLSVLPMGLGFSGLLTATLIALLANVEKSQIGMATGFVFVWRSLGQVSGVSFSQAIFQISLSRALTKRISDPEIVEMLRHSIESINDLPPDLNWLARQACRAAIQEAFLFAAAGSAVVLVTSLFIPDHTMAKQEETRLAEVTAEA